MVRNILIALAGLAGTCTIVHAQAPDGALPPPPESMAINSEGRSSSLGYVVSLGYFTQAQMQDPLWEFARAKIANMWWCKSEARLRRRDVRWVPANDGTDKQCAMAIYTSECLEPRDVDDHVEPQFATKLEQDLHILMTKPVPGPDGPDCGEKVRALRHDTKPPR